MNLEMKFHLVVLAFFYGGFLLVGLYGVGVVVFSYIIPDKTEPTDSQDDSQK